VRIYFDPSVILRVVLGEGERLREWNKNTVAVTSEITRVECLRTVDRLRFEGVDEHEIARRKEARQSYLGAMEVVPLRRAILDRAALPFTVRLRTLDALHLASALAAKRSIPALRFASHDGDLNAAAKAEGMPVLGAKVGEG